MRAVRRRARTTQTRRTLTAVALFALALPAQALAHARGPLSLALSPLRGARGSEGPVRSDLRGRLPSPRAAGRGLGRGVRQIGTRVLAQHETPPPPPEAAPRPAPVPQPAAAPVAAAPAKDDEGPPRFSLPTQSDRDAWLGGGFRLSLGFTYGRLVGLEGAPSGRLLGATVRVGLRLDAAWSVFASFQYNGADAPGGLSGLRFAGTIDPTWHATRHLSLALGLGFGGIVEGFSGRPDPDPLPGAIDTSYTFPKPSPPLPSCSGVGVAGLARAEWAFVLGPRTATSLGLEVLGQWTGCVQDTGRVEPDTGQAIVRRQWWPHVGATGTWSLTWR